MINDPKQAPSEDPGDTEFVRHTPENTNPGIPIAQSLGVNAPDAIIPSEAPAELSKKQVEAERKQEEGSDLDTTEGYVVDEGGMLNNFAIEPPMYVEGQEPPTK